MDNMKFFGCRITGLALLFAGIFLGGCQSQNYKFDPLADSSHPAAEGGAGQQQLQPVSAASSSQAATNSDILRVGDSVTVTFSDLANPVLPYDELIKEEDGSITLMHNLKFKAVGKTAGQLQKEIHDRYVPDYYVNLTVSVKAGTSRFYYVGGEVKSENRMVYLDQMTVLRAISTAGGFTDYARKTKVQVTRANGEHFTVDCKKALRNPELDPPVYPGDKIYVPKRVW